MLNTRLWCRRFGPKCAGCNQSLSPSDLVRRARDKVFHLNCFTCCVCRKTISTGEQLYVVDENKFMCKQDYLANKSRGNKLFLIQINIWRGVYKVYIPNPNIPQYVSFLKWRRVYIICQFKQIEDVKFTVGVCISACQIFLREKIY